MGDTLKQRLAAILAADVAGYSRLMAADERGTVGALDEARRLWAELLEINPKFSVEHLRRVLPFKDPAWFESFAGGLRRAGLVPA